MKKAKLWKVLHVKQCEGKMRANNLFSSKPVYRRKKKRWRWTQERRAVWRARAYKRYVGNCAICGKAILGSYIPVEVGTYRKWWGIAHPKCMGFKSRR